MYSEIKEIALKWGISERRIRTMVANGKIEGAIRQGRKWLIPNDSKKPSDGRLRKHENLFKLIEDKKRKLDKARPLTEGELERLKEEFTVEFTYNSNAIEGNTLTLRETDMVIRGLTIDKKPLKEHLEAIGHKEAFLYILEVVKEKPALDEKIIKQIHSLVLNDKPADRGVYRKIPVRILGAKTIPVEPYMIEEKLAEVLERYKNSDENIITRLARFHIEFENVHPFIDGNGRTGRLILNLELMKAGLPPIDIKFTDRSAYYDAFDLYNVNKDISKMEDLFARYINERLDRYLEILSV